ncbi:MAG: hypothetical protein QXY45_00350 [Candidatus Aenigmatarchaeota archaeon]
MGNERRDSFYFSLVILLGTIWIITQTFMSGDIKQKEILLKLTINIPIILGTFYSIKSDPVERRSDFSYWLIVGWLLILIGWLFPIIQAIYFGFFHGKSIGWFFYNIFLIPANSIYGLTLGLILILFKLEEKRKFLLFLLPLSFLFLFSIIYNFSYNLYFFDFGFSKQENIAYFSFDNGMRIWNFPACLWSSLFWSDMLVEFSITFFAFSQSITYLPKILLKFLKDKFGKGKEGGY